MRKEQLLKILRGNAKQIEVFQLQGKDEVYSYVWSEERKQYVFSHDGWEDYIENMNMSVLREIWAAQKKQIAEQKKNNIKNICKKVVLAFHENTAIVFDLPNTEGKTYILSVLDYISKNILLLWIDGKQRLKIDKDNTSIFPSKEFEATRLKNDFSLLVLGIDLKKMYRAFELEGLLENVI